MNYSIGHYSHPIEFEQQSTLFKSNCFRLISEEAQVLTFFVMNLGYFLPAEPRIRLVGGLTL